jgi:hypothetical protein
MKGQHTLTGAQRRRAVELHDQGLPYTVIGARFGVCSVTIRAIIKGIKRRPETQVANATT